MTAPFVVSYVTHAGRPVVKYVDPADLADVIDGLWQARIQAIVVDGDGRTRGGVWPHRDTGRLIRWAA